MNQTQNSEINLLRWRNYMQSAVLSLETDKFRIKFHRPSLKADAFIPPHHVSQNQRQGWFDRFGRRKVALFRDNSGLWLWLDDKLILVDSETRCSLKHYWQLPGPLNGWGKCRFEITHPSYGKIVFKYWAGRLFFRILDIIIEPFDFTAATMDEIDETHYDLLAFFAETLSRSEGFCQVLTDGAI